MSLIHGFARGKKRPKEYSAWGAMKARCYNTRHEQYSRYGGRGITVCESWRLSFTAFLKDMGTKPSPKHSLDRINNDGNYEPGNCRWATPEEQQKNKSNANLLTYGGVTKTIVEWAEETGIKPMSLYNRVNTLKWSAERTIETPIDARRTRKKFR